jgi:SAM-dependent methyltransferase
MKNVNPLFSNCRVPQLMSLFIKPDNKPYKTREPIASQYDPETTTPPGFSTDENLTVLNLLEHDLGWYMKRDTAPIPMTEDREGYHDGHDLAYWSSGLAVFLRLQRLYREYNGALKGGDVFFEMGAASGRVLRHAFFQSDAELQVMGCDINARNIDWMRSFLPSDMLIFQNTILPSLPLEDNSVDFFNAFSVFTHIDDLEFAWLMEIRRVLKKGGIAFLSIHSDMMWDNMGKADYLAWHLSSFIEKYSGCDYLTIVPSKELFLNPMPLKRITFWKKTDIYNTDIIHHSDYIRKEWGRFFEVRDILFRGIGIQDLVVLQKR